MKTRLYQWIKANSIMLVNAGSLVGTTVVTSVLGFAYWWLAARSFPPQVVGVASASISAMMLLGSFCMLGLGTLLITELPRQPGQRWSLISTALIVVEGAGGCIGVIFALVAAYASPEFQPLKASTINILTFATGVSLTAGTLVLDQALIGLLHGEWQLWRNTLFALAKLIALSVVGLWFSHQTGITIYATWAIGSALSLAALVRFVVWKKGWPGRACLPQWSLLRKLGVAALQHHLLNLTLQAPTLALPVMVTILLSATMNAWFYVSWMIASFVFVASTALTTVLHAMNSAQQSTLAHKARVTISLAFLTSVLANCLLQFATKQILSLFGSSYAAESAWSLRILALAAFPLIIKNHYISICRIQDRITGAMLSMLPGGILELGAAALGARLGSLSGLSLGWVIAIYLEALLMLPTVYKTLRSPTTAIQLSTVLDQAETEPIWLIDTFVLAAIRPDPINTSTQLFQRQSSVEMGTPKQNGQVYGDNRSANRNRLRPVRLQRETYP